MQSKGVLRLAHGGVMEPKTTIDLSGAYGSDMQIEWHFGGPGNVRIEHAPGKRTSSGSPIYWVCFDCTLCECGDALLPCYKVDDAMRKAVDVCRRLGEKGGEGC